MVLAELMVVKVCETSNVPGDFSITTTSGPVGQLANAPPQ